MLEVVLVTLLSGVTKGPADPAVREGTILGGHLIIVRMWDNLEKLNLSTSKAAHFALETQFFRDFTGVSS